MHHIIKDQQSFTGEVFWSFAFSPSNLSFWEKRCFAGSPRGLTKLFTEVYTFSWELQGNQRDTTQWLCEKKKNPPLRPIASYIHFASQWDATNRMSALPAHSPFQSAVRALSEGRVTATGAVPGWSWRLSQLWKKCNWFCVCWASKLLIIIFLTPIAGMFAAVGNGNGKRKRREDLQGVTAGTFSESAWRRSKS